MLTAAKVESNVTTAMKLDEVLSKFGKNPERSVGYKGGVFAFRDIKSMEEKEQVFNEASLGIMAATGTPEDLQRTLTSLAKNLQGDSVLASSVQQKAVQKLTHLRQHIPTPPPGMVPAPGAVYASPAEISNFLEILGASDDPVSVLASALDGTMNESALATIEHLYPAQTAGMKVEVTQILQDQEFTASLSYQQRLSLDAFVGGGREYAATPGALVINGNRSAQTQAQEAAQRGRPSPMRAPQTTNSASDNLANLSR
jgi:hypothetical protein